MRRLKIVPFKRKREGKTDYKKRLKLLVSEIPRLVVRKSSKNITVQIVTFEPKGDKILVSAHSNELKKFGWKLHRRNLPAAYLTGLLCGVKAKQKGINNTILDSGLYISIKGSLIYSALKGVIDSGLKVPCSEDSFPKNDRIIGTHIANYLDVKSKSASNNQFSTYTKLGIKPADIKKSFEETKSKILEGAKNAKERRTN